MAAPSSTTRRRPKPPKPGGRRRRPSAPRKSRPQGPRQRTPASDPADRGPQRLQKVLAAAGIASRRECERLILEGRVEVDRRVVTQLGTKVDPQVQDVRIDGTALPSVRYACFAVNKPKGVVSTSRDPAGRRRVIDLVPGTVGRVYTVGRLDKESEGLILVTNDGDLANRLTHPRYGIEKIYHVQVAGHPDREALTRLRKGVRLADGTVFADGVRVKRRHKQSMVLEIVLREGRNRELRRMLAAVGHKVQLLRRVAIGPISLGRLPVGEIRELSRSERSALHRVTARQGKPG